MQIALKGGFLSDLIVNLRPGNDTNVDVPARHESERKNFKGRAAAVALIDTINRDNNVRQIGLGVGRIGIAVDLNDPGNLDMEGRDNYVLLIYPIYVCNVLLNNRQMSKVMTSICQNKNNLLMSKLRTS